jgi:hypothetical protein
VRVFQPERLASARETGERMIVFHEFPKPLVKDMGIDLRRRNIGMSKQLLYDTKVGAVLEQMTCKCMAKDVR